jgi:hypothetical protein
MTIFSWEWNEHGTLSPYAAYMCVSLYARSTARADGTCPSPTSHTMSNNRNPGRHTASTKNNRWLQLLEFPLYGQLEHIPSDRHYSCLGTGSVAAPFPAFHLKRHESKFRHEQQGLKSVTMHNTSSRSNLYWHAQLYFIRFDTSQYNVSVCPHPCKGSGGRWSMEQVVFSVTSVAYFITLSVSVL